MLTDLHGRPFEVPGPTTQVETLHDHARWIDVPDERQDRWVNQLTGIGSWRDKTTAGTFSPVYRLWDPEIVDLFNGSDIAAKAIEAPAFEMFRRGFELTSDGQDASAIEDFREWATDTFDVEKTLENGSMFGSMFGGVLLVLGLDDGRDPWEPLDEERCKGVKYINQVDRRFAYAQSYYSDMDQPKYGRPELYLISNGVATSAFGRKSSSSLRGQGYSIGQVHESRCIRFDGNASDVTTQQLLAGWSWSVLQRPYDVLRQFDHAFDSAGYLLSDASQGVLTLQGLVASMAAGKKQALEDRMQQMELQRGVARAIALDAGGKDGKNAETFTRQTTSFAGLPDMLDRMMQRVCSALNMPVSKVFGRGAGGINAAGEADAQERSWYDRIGSLQTRDLTPKIKRLFRFLAMDKRSPLGKKGIGKAWKVKHHPLWSPTDTEQAATRYQKAQTDQIYITEGCVTPEIVSLTLTELYPKLDVEAIEESIDGAVTFDPHENDPDPDGGDGGGGPDGNETPTPVIPMPLLGTAGANATPGPGKGKALPAPAKPAVGKKTPGAGESGSPQPGKKSPPPKPVAKAPPAKPVPPTAPVKPKKKKADADELELARVDDRARDTDGKYGDEGAGVSRQAAALTEAADDGASHVAARDSHMAAAERHRFIANKRAASGDFTKSGEHTARAIGHDHQAGVHSRAALDAPQATPGSGLLDHADEQERVPAGEPGGGEFAGSGGGGGTFKKGEIASMQAHLARATSTMPRGGDGRAAVAANAGGIIKAGLEHEAREHEAYAGAVVPGEALVIPGHPRKCQIDLR
jgi:phage-related protein (TIGR01555 family)